MALAKYSTCGVLLLLSFITAVSILATAAPIPNLGWNIATPWGDLATSRKAQIFCMAGILLCLAATVITRRYALASVAMPMAAIIILGPSTYSLDTRPFWSPVQFEHMMETIPGQLTQSEVDAFISDGEALDQFWDERWSVIDTRLRLGWPHPTDEALSRKLSTIRDRVPLNALISTIPGLRKDLSNALESLQGTLKSQSNIENDRKGCPAGEISEMITYQAGSANYPEYGIKLICRKQPDYPALISGGNAEIAKINGKLSPAIDIISSQLRYVDSLSDRSKFLSTQADIWRKSLAISIALATSIAMVSLRIPQGWILPAATAGFAGILLLAGHVASPEWVFAAPQFMYGMNAVFFLCIFLSFRIIYLFSRDNSGLWQILSRIRKKVFILRTIMWWCPIGAVALVGLGFSNHLNTILVDASYRFPIHYEGDVPTHPGCENPDRRLIFPQADQPRNLEIDVDNAVNCYTLGVQAMIQQASSADTAAAITNSNDYAVSVFDAVVPNSLPCNADGTPFRTSCISDAFNYPECSWWELVCKVKIIPHRTARDAYSSARRKSQAQFNAKVEQITGGALEATDEMKASIQSAAEGEVQNARLAIRDGLYAGFRAADAVGMISWVVFTIAVMKSLGYIMGRVIFAQAASRRIKTHWDPDPVTPEQVTISKGPRISINEPGNHYIRMGSQPSGVSTKAPWFPRPWTLLIARFPFRYLFAWFTIDDRSPRAGYSADKAEHFVSIELRAGQRIALNLPNLYSFSQTTSFRRRWYFGFTNLFRGRISLVEMQGPGTICLRSRGEPTMPQNEANSEFTPASRLMMWSSDQSFEVDSRLNFSNIYMGNIVIRPSAGAHAGLATDAKPRVFSGALIFIPILLFPI